MGMPAHRRTAAKYVRQFYLGGAGSGANVHAHYNAVNILAFGMKRWFLYPPHKAWEVSRTADPTRSTVLS